MRTKKALLAALCAALLVVGSVMGTMAYLTSTDTVTNTFTYGQVKILLDEKDVDGSGTNVTTEGRDKANEYHLLPGHTYEKDPTVTVLQNSEEAYVRMMVKVDGFDSLKAALPEATFPQYYDATTHVFLLQYLCNWDSANWTYVPGETDATDGIYEFRYNGKVAKDTAKDTPLPALFTEITVPGADINNDNIDDLAAVKIVVTAEAVQADGFNTAALAWDTIDNK